MERRESNKRRKTDGGAAKGKTQKLIRNSAIEKDSKEEEKVGAEPKKYESGSEEEYDAMGSKKPSVEPMVAQNAPAKEESSDDEFKEKPEQEAKKTLL